MIDLNFILFYFFNFRLTDEIDSKKTSKDLESRYIELENCIKEKENKIFELEAELGCSQHELNELKLQNKDFEKVLDDNRSIINGLNTKIEALNEDLLCANDDLLAALDKAEVSKNAENLLQAKSDEVESLKKDIEISLSERLETVTVLENENLQLRTNLESAENIISEGKLSFSDLQSKYDEILTEKIAMEQKLADFTRLENDIISLNSSLEESQKTAADTKASFAELQLRFETLVIEKNEMEENLKNLSNEAEYSKSEFENDILELKGNLEAAQKMIADGRLVLEERDSKYHSLSLEKIALEERLAAVAKDSEYEEKVQSLEKHISELKEQVEVVFEEKTKLEEKLEKEIEDKLNLIRLHEMSEQPDSNEFCSPESTEGSCQTLIELETALEASNKTISQLQENLSKVTMVSDGLKQHSEELKDEIKTLKIQRKAMEEKFYNLNQCYQQSVARIEELDLIVKSAEELKEIAGNKFQQMHDEKLQLERSLEELQFQVGI